MSIPAIHPTKSLENLIEMAVSYGVARDQLERFLGAGYFPLPKQLQFHAYARQADHPNGPSSIMQGGGRGGSKSHSTFAQIALDDCQREPNLTTLIIRKVGKVAKEQVNKLRTKLLLHIPHEYNKREGWFGFHDSGSTLQIGHYRDPDDINKYLGLEYDIIAVEEPTQIPREILEKIPGSLRTSKLTWRPRDYYATNPGGVGHEYLRQKFYIPYQKKREQFTRYIHSTYKDNPFIDEGYKRYLLSLTGTLGKFWRDGDWDAKAGQFFSTFDHDLHVIPSIDLSKDAPLVLSYDHGHAHYAVAHLNTQIDGMKITIDEFYARRWLVPDITEGIYNMLDFWGRPPDTLTAAVAGHDIFGKRGGEQDGMTIANQFHAAGLPFTKANINRLMGAGTMLTMLGNPEVDREPTWQITERCNGLITTLPLLEADPNRPEDVKKWNASSNTEGGIEEEFTGDDFYDSDRYGLMEIAGDEIIKQLAMQRRHHTHRNRRTVRQMMR